MQTTNQPADFAAPARAIPPPPGGGSWRFDETAWAWVSNDPAPPIPAEQPSATDQKTTEE